MKNINLILSTFFFGLTSFFICSIAQANTNYSATGKLIKIATEGAYPPFNLTTAEGDLAGFDIDIGRAICAEIEADCEFIAQDWDRLIPNLNAGKYDAIIAGVGITNERKQHVDFSLPYYVDS